jgi:glycosyltransferase involved in cell wall biosynthesis
VIFVVFQTGSRANGGVESITQVIEQASHIRSIVVTQLETPINRRWRAAGAEVLVWPLAYAMSSSFWRSGLRAKIRRLLSMLRLNWRMARLVRATGCAVVHCNDIFGLWHTAPGARVGGARIIHNIRDIKGEDERFGWHWRAALWLSHRTLVLSQEMRDALVRRLALPSGSGIDYVYSIVDLEEMQPAKQACRALQRARLGIADDEYAIGYVAGFNPKKAQLDFIERAGPQLRAALPRGRVYFIGDFEPERDGYARACLEAARHQGLEETVRFVGFSAGVADWYQALDLVVLASRNEGLARCMIESLACGTPVVSFDVCSAHEILHAHDCGVVVPQGDYMQLVEQIAALATATERRRVLGQNGARAARMLFEPARVVQAYEALYR